MRKAKIVTVVGARPQFVKAAALSPELAKHTDIEEVILHTGQHFDPSMSDVFFREMSIPEPRYNLGIGGGSHGQNTGRMIEKVEQILDDERPDALVVFGDTDSTLAAAITAAKLGIMLAHVEAGLRSYRRSMPEEINRILTDHAADVLYAPSDQAVETLRGEGIDSEKIVLSGDVMKDVIVRFAPIAAERSSVLSRLGLCAGGYNLLTLHRKENTDEPEVLERIFRGLEHSRLPIVFPIHPRTEKRLREFQIDLPKCVRGVEPQGYLDTILLLAKAQLVLTDSGGVQKEACFLGRPCVTLRDETEWTELVEAGVNVLVGSDVELIRGQLNRDDWPEVSAALYGQGTAGQLIAADLADRVLSR